jgi:hypothetical protein
MGTMLSPRPGRVCEHVGCERPIEFLWTPNDDRQVVLCKSHRDKLVKMARRGFGWADHLKKTPLTVEALMEYADCHGLTDDDADMLLDYVVKLVAAGMTIQHRHDGSRAHNFEAARVMAAKINCGLYSQIKYLLGVLGPRDTKLAIDEAVSKTRSLRADIGGNADVQDASIPRP